MSLRVIAGSAKGMKLKAVPGDSTRPIMDRVKESLFNIIGEDIFNAVMLDLFSGTGSVGIEALSRGAEHVVFIDLNRRAIKTTQDNLRHTKLAEKATVVQRNAFDVISRPPDRLYHYLYIAPPQYKNLWKEILENLENNTSWHNPETIVIVQIDPKEYLDSPSFSKLVEYDQRKYGRTLLLFYEFADYEESTNIQESEN